MTIIAALNDGERTHIVSDTLIRGNGRSDFFEKKWELRGAFAVGVSGPSSVAQVVKHRAEEWSALLSEDAEDSAWRFRAGFIHFLQDSAFSICHNDEGIINLDVNLIVAAPQYIILFDTSLGYEVYKPGDICTAGSGSRYADGADFVAKHAKLEAKQRLHLAAAAACKYDHWCGGEIWYATLG